MSTFASDKLFSLSRNGAEEIVIHGHIVVSDADRVLYSTSESRPKFPARSTLKPFQFLATHLPAELWVRPGLTRYTACVGSVSASADQVKQIDAWYAAAEFRSRVAKLKFTSMWPRDEVNRVQLQAAAAAQRPSFHYCFSKHMAILEACEIHGWDLETYNSENHPFFKSLKDILQGLLGTKSEFLWAVDGCTLPTPILPLGALAKLYQRLAFEPGDMGKVKEMMLHNPEWVGGPGRVDTELMRANGGKLIAKEGADGLLALGILPSKRFPKGLGVVLKTMAGWLPQFSMLALAPLLDSLGLKYSCDVPRGQKISYHYTPFETINAAYFDLSPSVSERIAVWPGDKSYRRTVSLNTLKGDHMSLSSIETTVHVGTHTDAPNHFEKNKNGIDSVSLAKYWGPCQVVEVEKSRGSTIQTEDLARKEIRAPRILFKTNSFPDPENFNQDFVALSPELIEYLAKEGVCLVGIDTPSIDLFASKELLTHHAIARHDMAVLEGVMLGEVSEGMYELMAVPLKLNGADASPVRAILFKNDEGIQ